MSRLLASSWLLGLFLPVQVAVSGGVQVNEAVLADGGWSTTLAC